ncbi:MAG: hypothetical protein R3E79_13125 [Caldilineaceae bacterium]
MLFVAFLSWERRQRNPFVELSIFTNRMFGFASLAGGLRMVVMAGQGFLIPLYLVDVHAFNAASIGSVTMIGAGTMALIVRYGGQVADNWGSPLAYGDRHWGAGGDDGGICLVTGECAHLAHCAHSRDLWPGRRVCAGGAT